MERKINTARLAAAIAAAWCVGSVSAEAQDHTNEPRLDPLFGDQAPQPQKASDTQVEEIGDGAFDEDGFPRFRKARGLVGLATFLTPETTNLSVGFGPAYRPDYFGSNDYKWEIDPATYVRFKNFVFLDDNGADFALFGFSRFSFGPTLRLSGSRRESDNEALRGLGNIPKTFEFGGFAAATFRDRYSFRFKTRHGLKTGHRGTVVDAALTALLFRYGNFSTSVSAESTWVGNRYADRFFSITPEQSARSGLPVFDSSAGFRDIGGSFNGYINIHKHWSINPYFSYRHIFNNIATTPIISQYGTSEQWEAGFHLLREFQFRQKKAPRRFE